MPREGKIQIIKYAPPPLELPVLGSVPPEDISYIGRTNYIAALEEKFALVSSVLTADATSISSETRR